MGTVRVLAESEPEPVAGKDIWEVPHDLKELQRQDESLKELFGKATVIEGVSTGQAKALLGEFLFVQQGLLYHQPEGSSNEQLVIPCSLRPKILSLGHDIPWAGHLGSVKTLQRIADKFFWPGIYTDVYT